VVTEGETAKDAIARNNTVMTTVIEGLKGAGIAARDIQTAALLVEPKAAAAAVGATSARAAEMPPAASTRASTLALRTVFIEISIGPDKPHKRSQVADERKL
jgi:heptaprenylglyceryl phosphate synthase